MACEIVMPQLGLTMTEGSVNGWLKQPGERVAKGELLFTVSTDKVDMEVESTGTGFFSPVIETGITVSVGTIIAVLADQPGDALARAQVSNGKASTPATPVQESAKSAEPVSQKRTERDGRQEAGRWPGPQTFPASPRARSLAKSLGLDIAEVTPADGGRIVEADVKRHQPAGRAPKLEPMSAARRMTAKRTSESFERAPHFYLGREVDAGALVKLRAELQDTAQRTLGFRLTYTDFLLRALAMALREEPKTNAHWQDDAIAVNETIDVAFAVQTDKGLLVPVIREAEKLSLLGIAAARKTLSERARDGKLAAEDLQGGSATLSNLGAHAIDWFQAILNPPQSVILASGAIVKKPAVVENRVQVADRLILTLSADHRVLDGVIAAAFLGSIARMVENPLELLV